MLIRVHDPERIDPTIHEALPAVGRQGQIAETANGTLATSERSSKMVERSSIQYNAACLSGDNPRGIFVVMDGSGCHRIDRDGLA